ncbi:tail fiber [uncultured Mediterranean phage uvMED]|nr:tail fiber [uncultured Mediterranean phage uvMED]BAR17177.1 tail fiber [uncultured Mediterranean phage uvMED]BAR17238.1 tail fiber [uncultured Mediterranean phage uvMED]BAR17263.1 tail fiber [uncultured Mediterranean phage uvMED]BAR17381.1 tail fiber [uncultured Mediterranean phage uvMED]
MAILVNDTTPRNQYTASAGQTVFAYSFEIFEVTDIKVFKGSTLLTYASSPSGATQYSVSGAGTTGGGNVTLGGGATVNDIYTIVRDIPVKRTTDFPLSGPFVIDSLNTDLDKMIGMMGEREDEISRSIRLTDDDSTATLTLPLKADRASKVLTFSSTGNVETSITATDVSTVAGISSNITTVSGIASNVTTVAGISSNVTTVAGKASEVTSVAAVASLITSDFVSDLNTLAVTDVINDINTLATSDIVSDLNTLATSDVVSDLNTLATSDVVTDLNKLATTDIVNDLNTLATTDIVSDLNTLATSDIISDLNTLATSDIVTDLSLLATSANVTNMATLGASGVVANIATVAGANSNISTVAGISSNISTVAGNTTNINTVAGANSNITSVAGSISNVNSVASNLSTVNDFANRYRVTSSDPSSSLDEGDLAYNTTSNVLKYYNGSAWVTIVAGSLTDVVQDGSPQLGGDLDINGNSIVSTSNGNIAITPNGSGKVVLDGLSYPVADGSANQALLTNGSGVLSFGTIQASELSTEGNFFSNYNTVSSDVTSTTASTKNAFLFGPITVSGSSVWTISGSGTLQIL